MTKAKFVKRLKCGYKYGKKVNDILVYSYRGYEYTIEDIPPYKRPAWYLQNAHATEQNRIDMMIDRKQQPQAEEHPFDLNEIFDLLEW